MAYQTKSLEVHIKDVDHEVWAEASEDEHELVDIASPHLCCPLATGMNHVARQDVIDSDDTMTP